MPEIKEGKYMKDLKDINNVNIDKLYNQITILIENAKKNVAIKVNNEMTVLYWSIGKDITENILKYEKAEYGKSIIKKLSEKLITKYGRGYGIKNIFRMLRFYECFPDFNILSTLSTKLSWSHYNLLMRI